MGHVGTGTPRAIILARVAGDTFRSCRFKGARLGLAKPPDINRLDGELRAGEGGVLLVLLRLGEGSCFLLLIRRPFFLLPRREELRMLDSLIVVD